MNRREFLFAAARSTIIGRRLSGEKGSMLKGGKGQREWVFIQLARQWYVRDAKWKLEQLNPAAGYLDQGNGSGRHANRDKKRKKA